MNEITRLSIILTRNEKWRIREMVYCNRTGRKKEPQHSNTDGLLSEHYFWLLKAFRSEMESHLQRNNCCYGEDDNGDCGYSNKRNAIRRSDTGTIESFLNADGTNLEIIRHNPEIMMKVYSYLPLCDRICRLSLVDRAFSRDKIRGGIVSATYGGGFNLKQALLELQRWAIEEFEKHSDDEDTTPMQLQKSRKRIAKISRMMETANLAHDDVLLFTGSNLTNIIVSPSYRRRWMTSYACNYFAREKEQWNALQQQQHQQQQQQYQGNSWLTDIVLLQKFLKGYFFDGTVNKLRQLMLDVDFLEEDYAEYKKCQRASRNHVDEDETMVWCLPNLAHGCTLLLLDPDGDIDGCWKEHRFVACAGCSKVHEASNGHGAIISCDHGHHGHFCDNCCCRRDSMPNLGCSFVAPVQAMSICEHCEMIVLRRIGDG